MKNNYKNKNEKSLIRKDITHQHPSAHMIRINMEYSHLPHPLTERGLGVGIQAMAAPTFTSLLQKLGK
jgi:hypothetical protein